MSSSSSPITPSSNVPKLMMDYLTNPERATPLNLPLVSVFVVAQCLAIGLSSSTASNDDVLLLWQWMLLFFLLFGATTFFTNSPAKFFSGGREFSSTESKEFTATTSTTTTFWTLTLSSFITWVFAKSVYNSSTLGAEFGWVGPLAYACYYVSFLSAASVIYQHRLAGFSSLPEVIHVKYGSLATVGFLLVCFISLSLKFS